MSDGEMEGGRDGEMPPLLTPTVRTDGGPWMEHNMPCAVNPEQSAVIDCETGIFMPGRAAEAEGWMLIKAPKWLRPWLQRFTPPWPQRRGA